MIRRAALVLVVVLVAAPLLLAGALWVAVSTGVGRSTVEAAVERATGHPFRIAGPIRVVPGLVPKIEVSDVALLNPPGFSRPDLASARRIEVDVALRPLLRGIVEIRRLRLESVDARLEVNADGHGNWEKPPRPPSASPDASREARRVAVLLRQVELDDSVVAWGRSSDTRRLSIPRLTATGTETLDLAGQLEAGGVPLAVTGAIGSAPPYKADLTVTGNGVRLAVDAEGGDAPRGSVAGEISGPALDARLAGLSGLKLDAAWSPSAAHAHATIASWDLAPGLRATSVVLDAAALDQPATLTGTLSGLIEAAVSARTGTLGALMAGSPLPLAVTATGGGGTARIEGVLTDPKNMRGLDAKLSSQLSNLAAFAPGAPPLRDLSLSARLVDAQGGGGRGIALRDLAVAALPGDLAGDLAAFWTPRPALRGALRSHQLDLDALLAALRARNVPPPPAGTAPTATPQPGPPPGSARLIPDTPVPTTDLRAVDGDVTYGAEALTLRGSAFRSVQAHASLANGVLRLDPISAVSSGGPVEGQVGLDTASAPPRLSVVVHAPAIDLSTVLAGSAGTVAVNADLRGQGTTWRQVASTASGEVTLSGVDGQVDLAALRELDEALRHAGVSPGSGQAQIRCLALRAVAQDGIATVNPLLLDAGKLALQGQGQVDLRDEAPDLHLRAGVQLGGAHVEIPLRVTGSLAAPKVAAEATGGRFNLSIGADAGDPCGPALAVARGGQPGPEPAPLPKASRAGRPADLLRSLLR